MSGLIGKIVYDFRVLAGFIDMDGPTLMEEVRHDVFMKYCEEKGLDYDVSAKQLAAMDRAYISSGLS